jgi:hypothetical protein
MNHAGRYTNKKNAESYCEYMNKYLGEYGFTFSVKESVCYDVMVEKKEI